MSNPPAFPPTAAASFTAKGEEFAEAFVMDFDITGKRFSTRLTLPTPADPGEAYLIFYASFYQKDAKDSMIETGLSISYKGWNLLSKVNGQKKPPEDCIFTKGDPRKHLPVDLVVSFEPQRQGGAVAKVSAGTNHRVDHIPLYKPVGRMRLIVGAANHTHGHFAKAGISLHDVDHKPVTAVGSLIWMPGSELTKSESRLKLLHRSSSGFSCELPPAPPAMKV